MQLSKKVSSSFALQILDEAFNFYSTNAQLLNLEKKTVKAKKLIFLNAKKLSRKSNLRQNVLFGLRKQLFSIYERRLS